MNMYHKNPTIESRWPGDQDPVAQSLHLGNHCLFYNPSAEFKHIEKKSYSFETLIKWANEWLVRDGIDKFAADTNNHRDICRLVRLNMWIRDIRKQGIVKPLLLVDEGNGNYSAATGGNRLRVLEYIPEIQTVPAFISTHRDRSSLYTGLESVTCLDRFAELCSADPGKNFYFRLTDAAAPYGMHWYEYSNNRTRLVTPYYEKAVNMFTNYARANPNLFLTKEYFDQEIIWDDYYML